MLEKCILPQKSLPKVLLDWKKRKKLQASDRAQGKELGLVSAHVTIPHVCFLGFSQRTIVSGKHEVENAILSSREAKQSTLIVEKQIPAPHEW